MQMTRNLNEESEKNISMGIGVVGNTLRMQMEKMQDMQKGMHSENEKGFMSVLEQLQDQFHKEAERQKATHAAIEEYTSRQLEELRDFSKHLEKQDVEKMRGIGATIEECAEQATRRQLEDLREFQKGMTQKETEKLKLIQGTIEEFSTSATNRQMEELRAFQKHIEGFMKEQLEHQKKTNSCLTSALGAPEIRMMSGSSEGKYGDSLYRSDKYDRDRDEKPSKWNSRPTGAGIPGFY
jgi:type I site-specific restriction endonuclease